jgi:phosphotransferase system  glucose/maltose/N-acetylglucosamine-specific IIC component
VLLYLAPAYIIMVLALLHDARLFRANRLLYGPALLALGLFGGLAWHTGMDWPAYQEYSDYLDTAQNPLTFYFSNPLNVRFELGYYLLNWGVKRVGLDYQTIQLLSSVFLSYAVYRLTRYSRHFPGNKFYILSLYLSFNYLVLHFAQVRQAFAMGFFLLACASYLDNGRKGKALAIALLALLFQYSAIVYIFLAALVMWWPERRAYRIFLVTLLAIGGIVPLIIDPYTLFGLFATTLAQKKINWYRDNPTGGGIGQIVYCLYLALFAAYLARYRRIFQEPRHAFVIRFAILSLLASVLATFVFRENYVMYARVYAVGCLFQGFAASLIFATRRGWVHRAVFVGSTFVAVTFYTHVFSLYETALVPYHSILEINE